MPVVDLNFELHKAQLEVYLDPRRFKVVAAGRRFGKSYLSAVSLLVEALKEENERGYKLGASRVVYYVAPTFQQAHSIMWKLLKELGSNIIEHTVENTGMMRLVNGREIHLKGSDRPDTLRGVGLSYVVLDEYASMKPQVWEEILRPTLADVMGGALFIGTPAGKNHFYKLFKDHENDSDWATFTFKTVDNPFLDKREIKNAKNAMSRAAFRQEFEASFSTQGGSTLNPSDLVYGKEPTDGSWYIAVDPAGFEAVASGKGNSKYSSLDETAIAVVKVSQNGWYIKEIQHGRWDVRETALRILRAGQVYRPTALGIEKGALKNALMPYLNDSMLRLNVFPNIVDLSHGGKKKTDRIVWALQGRLEHGRLQVPDDDPKWLEYFTDQMADFPNPLAHDDLLDAVAYIDQLATTIYFPDRYDAPELDNWHALDSISGY